MKDLEKNVLGYPSHFIDPEVKKGKQHCMAHAKAFVSECRTNPTQTYIFRDRQNYTHLRNLARGQQDPNQYKEMVGLKKEAGKVNKSYRNLNFEILKVAPKFRSNLINRVLSKPYSTRVRTIDNMAMTERRKLKSQIEEYRTNYNQIQEFEKLTKIKMDQAITEEQLAMTPQELDIYMDMNPRDLTSLEIKDYLTANFALNDWNQIGEELAGDFADLGVGCLHVYIDEAGVIRQQRWMPERVVANKCIYNDFRDMIRVGVYQEMTVADLKRRTKGQFGEEEYKNIARTIAEGGASKYNKPADHYWNGGSYSYAYDHEKVTVFTCYWYSVDDFTYVEYKNEAGNTRVKNEAWDYVPFKGDKRVNEGKGMSDVEYNKMYAGVKSIIRNQVKNVYKCSWVVDTEHAFDYGLMTSMPRYSKSIAETKLPVIIYTTDFMSPFGNVENALDIFQLNWLQFQSHLSTSKPPGLAIERNALIKAGSKAGQAGKSVDWKKLLQMYAETGSIVFDGYDNEGRPLPYLPIQELKNGLSPGALEHFNVMIQMLDLIRNMMGINELVEGQAPPERLGKSVAEMTFGAAEVNISHMHRAYKFMYERACRMVVDLIPDAFDQGVLPGMMEMLGMETMQFFNLNRDLNLRDIGILVEEGPDDLIRERISLAIQIAIERQELDPEDAVYVELEENPYRAIHYLKMKRREKMRQVQQSTYENMDYQSQKNQEDAAAAGQMKAQELKMKIQADQQKLVTSHQLKMSEEDKKFLHTVLLEKMKNGHALTFEEKNYMHDYSRDLLKGRFDLQKQSLANKAKSKMSSNPKR